jgi:hypothetical protein
MDLASVNLSFPSYNVKSSENINGLLIGWGFVQYLSLLFKLCHDGLGG